MYRSVRLFLLFFVLTFHETSTKTTCKNDDGKYDWETLETLTDTLNRALKRRDDIAYETALDGVVDCVPKKSLLAYMGLETGYRNSLVVGLADYWRGSGRSMRLDQWQQDSSVLTIDRNLRGVIVVYIGEDKILQPSSLAGVDVRSPKEGFYPVYGLSNELDLRAEIGDNQSPNFWLDNSEVIGKNKDSRMIAVSSKDWDMKELVKGKVTVVIADYLEKYNHLRVCTTVQAVKTEDGFGFGAPDGLIRNCLKGSTDRIINFLGLKEHQI